MKARTGITHVIRDGWIQKWEKANRQHDTYTSFIQTQDIISDGAKNRTPDYEKKGQDRDFLSLNEQLFFLHLLRSPEITWIKEQYPLLPIERAMAIAKEIGVRYPTYPYTSSVEVVMTTDFLCGTVFGYRAVYSIKDERAFVEREGWSDKRKVNFDSKLTIDRLFWESHPEPTKWFLIKSTYLKNTYSQNLQKLAPYYHLNYMQKLLLPEWLCRLNELFNQTPFIRIADLIERSASAMQVKFEDALAMFNHSIWHKFIKADLNKKLNMEVEAAQIIKKVVTNA